MGIYLNPGNNVFQRAVNSKIYVDKTEMLAYTNSILNTEQQFICISRPRRFGKSMAANMLAAYYSRGCNSKELFSPFQIAKVDSFEKHLNQYNVIQINMADFAKKSDSLQEILKSLQDSIVEDIKKEYPDFRMPRYPSLLSVLEWHYLQYKQPFVIIIDDWDCIIRMKQFTAEDQMDYLHFLLVLLKDESYVALAFMTGILPIKKSGNQLSVDMFTEVTMTFAAPYDEFTGFTEEEVMVLCQRYQYDPQEMDAWYGGYRMNRTTIYHPSSVVDSILNGKIQNYWETIETPKELSDYINLSFDSLREKIAGMIAGEKIKVNPAKFQNDLTSFRSADDVLTLLIHLGYLTYDFDTQTAWIPNNEARQEFINSIEDGGWEEIMNAIRSSDELIQATLDGDTATVEKLIARSHEENTSILKYNDENSLACVISLAYYTARKNYIMHRELSTGKGFADIVYIPRKNVDTPALVIELKHNQPAGTAIEQIKAKNYPEMIAEYTGEIILVGISYDDEKGHSCEIERIIK